MTTTLAARGGYGDAVRVREFRTIALSSLVSIFGDAAAYLAVTVLVYQRTASPLLSALTFAAAFAPYLLGGTLFSSLTERWPPRRLLIGCDLVAGTLVALLALPHTPVWGVFVVLLVIGSLAPLRSGTAANLVATVLPGPEFVAGRSVQRLVSQAAQIAGAGAGGALLVAFGARGALLVDVVTFVVSAAVVRAGLTVRAAGRSGARRSVVADSIEGLRIVWRLPAVRRLLLLDWLIGFVAVAPEALAAPAVQQAGASSALTGVWLLAVPVGVVLGDAALVLVLRADQRSRTTVPLAFAVPVVLLLFGLRPPLAVQFGLLVVLGLTLACSLGIGARLRDVTPAAEQSRMWTLSSTGLMVGQGVGFAAAGAVGSAVTAGAAIATAGAVGLGGVLALTIKLSSAQLPGPGSG